MAEKSPNANNTNKISFTEGESSLLLAIMTNLTAEIQFDADKVATQLGYKNTQVVRARWNQVKRAKLSASAEGASPTGIRKRSSPAKKASSKVNDDDHDAIGEAPTPQKKRIRKAKSEANFVSEDAPTDNEMKVKQEQADGTDEDEALADAEE